MAAPVVFFDLGDTLVDVRERTWLPGAKALLAQLKQDGVRVGIVSNTADLPDRAAILKLLPPDFDFALFESALIVFSSEAGHAKPQPEIWFDAIACAQRPAGECVYVGENPVETAAAREAGMRAILVPRPPGSSLSGVHDAILEPGSSR